MLYEFPAILIVMIIFHSDKIQSRCKVTCIDSIIPGSKLIDSIYFLSGNIIMTTVCMVLPPIMNRKFSTGLG